MKTSTFYSFLQEKFTFLDFSELTDNVKELSILFDLIPFGTFISKPSYTGRPRCWLASILKSFLLKAAYKITENKQLREVLVESEQLRKICGFITTQDIPSLPTFSRVFQEFAEMKTAEHIHEFLVKKGFKGKITGHISRDASSIEAREKPKKKVKVPKPKKKRGRPPKNTPPKRKELKRIEKQEVSDLSDMLKELPKECDTGYKINSKGSPYWWKGYKLHADWSDEGIPVSFIVTSASLHDSQVAIPLTELSSKRTTYLYELMDAGYDVKEIYSYSRKKEHVPIIRPNKRRKSHVIPLDPAKSVRYRIRTTAERGFASLKDDYLVEKSRFRGYEKVNTHIGFAMIALTFHKMIRHYSDKFNLIEE